MLKRLLAALLVTALLAPGCGKKKAADSSSGSAATGAAPTATGGDVANSGAAAPGPGVIAAAGLATSSQQNLAPLIKALNRAPPAAKAIQVGKLVDAIVAIATDAARDRSWDPASVVASVGTDRVKLFAWVRDRTSLVPYRGVLRGSTGVMMDRVGNSLDRSLLLATLVASTGGEVRLAHATLEPAVAEKLAADWAKRPKSAFPTTPENEKVSTDALATLGGEFTAVAKSAAARKAASADIAAKVRAQVAAEAGALAKLIEGTPAAAPDDAAALGDHWWVEVKDGDVWSDLDPTQANPGDTLATATETLARDAIPDDLRHTLTVRVVGEVWQSDKRSETMLVEHSFAPAEFYGQQLEVTNIPLDFPDATKLDGEKDRAAAARAAIVAQTEWMPLIRLGTTPIAMASVSDTGDVYKLEEGNEGRLGRIVARTTRNGVGGATKMLEGMPDGTEQAPPPQPVAGPHAGFTAEWIEFEIRAPGSPPRVVRRTVFDALGAPADRNAAKPIALADPAKLDRGLALFGETEILPQFARAPRSYTENRIAKYLTAAKPTIVAIAQSGGVDPPDSITTPLHSALPPPSELDALADLRFAWGAESVFIDRLDVLTAPRRLASIDGTFRLRQAFDIVANGVGSWGTPAEARAARLAQGVADTVAESVVRPCVPGVARCFRGPNTSDAFDGAKGWQVVKDLASPAIAALPPAARSVAAADLASGYAIIPAPHAPTWWRVRLDTGETLGQGAAGGQAFTEYVMQVWLRFVGMGLGWGACALGASGSSQVGCAIAVGVAGVGSFMPLVGIEMELLAALVGVIYLVGIMWDG